MNNQYNQGFSVSRDPASSSVSCFGPFGGGPGGPPPGGPGGPPPGGPFGPPPGGPMGPPPGGPWGPPPPRRPFGFGRWGYRRRWGYGPGYGGGGCYVATCVYQSYDCPQVWVLRRYRDNVLAKSVFGRMFIRAYYRISPAMVRMFGKTRMFQAIFRPFLDHKVEQLKEEGFLDSPYRDQPIEL